VLLTPESGCRNLPKLAWVFLVLLLPLVGSIAWLVAGRQWDRTAAAQRPSSRVRATSGPTRRVPTNPDDDEEFLAGLKLRAEEQRRRAREQPEPGPDGDAG
jgi:hypothetical protein